MEGHFKLGPWLVQPRLNTVSRNGTPIHLTPKVMGVLVCLAAHAGEPVSKEELLQTTWPDTFVGDDVLKSSISELRRVFEDDAKEPRIIQTIPKRGYRLMVQVEPVDGLQMAAPRLPVHGSGRAIRKWWIAVLVSGGAVAILLTGLATFKSQGLRRLLGKSDFPQIRSVAVLPLENLSGDPGQEYFSDGMTDALITDLAQISSLKVISRTSSMQYKLTKKSLPQIARELNVDGIVEGTVQRSGDRVRITAQLIEASKDKHLWVNSYERDMRDVFAIEQDVTADIARQVQARITIPNQSPSAPPKRVDPKALEAYLQGSYYLNSYGKGAGDEEKNKAAEYFQQAIDAEPGFAPAYNGLANAHFNLLWPSSQDAEIQMRATGRALEIDPNYSDARANLANIKFSHWDFRGGEEEYRRAIALSPNNANAHDGLCDLLFRVLRGQEGMRECQTAQELDPAGNHLSEAFYSAGEYDRAIDIVQSMLRSDPSNGALHHSLFRYYAAKGMYKEASQEIEKTFALFGNSEGAARIHRASVLSGDRAALRQAAAEGEHWIATKQAYIPGNVAGLYAILGDKDRAFYWLDIEYKNHDKQWNATDIGLEDINATPLFDSLRSDPRFKDLLRRVGLPP